MNVSESCQRLTTEDEGLRINSEGWALESLWRASGDIAMSEKEGNGWRQTEILAKHRNSKSQQNQTQHLRIPSFLYASTMRDSSLSGFTYANKW